MTIKRSFLFVVGLVFLCGQSGMYGAQEKLDEFVPFYPKLAIYEKYGFTVVDKEKIYMIFKFDDEKYNVSKVSRIRVKKEYPYDVPIGKAFIATYEPLDEEEFKDKKLKEMIEEYKKLIDN